MVKGKDSGLIPQENRFDSILNKCANSRPLRVAATLLTVIGVGLAHVERPTLAENQNNELPTTLPGPNNQVVESDEYNNGDTLPGIHGFNIVTKIHFPTIISTATFTTPLSDLTVTPFAACYAPNPDPTILDIITTTFVKNIGVVDAGPSHVRTSIFSATPGCDFPEAIVSIPLLIPGESSWVRNNQLTGEISSSCRPSLGANVTASFRADADYYNVVTESNEANNGSLVASIPACADSTFPTCTAFSTSVTRQQPNVNFNVNSTWRDLYTIYGSEFFKEGSSICSFTGFADDPLSKTCPMNHPTEGSIALRSDGTDWRGNTTSGNSSTPVLCNSTICIDGTAPTTAVTIFNGDTGAISGSVSETPACSNNNNISGVKYTIQRADTDQYWSGGWSTSKTLHPASILSAGTWTSSNVPNAASCPDGVTLTAIPTAYDDLNNSADGTAKTYTCTSAPLPDLNPTSSSMCYRPVSGDPTKIEFVASATLKNIGAADAGASTSRIIIRSRPAGCDLTDDTAVPLLTPNQSYTVKSSEVVGSVPAACASQSLNGGFRGDYYNVVIESDETNNGYFIPFMSACPITPSLIDIPRGTPLKNIPFPITVVDQEH